MNVRYKTSYDIAQICLNGHVVNHSTQRRPEANRKHCSRCGAETITDCPRCNDSITGMSYGRGPAYYERPAYCSSCGGAYPWTEARLKALEEFAEEQIAEEDRNRFADIIENLVSETPRTPLAVERMKKLLEKVGPAASEMVRKLTTDLLSEAMKKAIWGP